MKKKTTMYRTFKADIFGSITAKQNGEKVAVTQIIAGKLVISNAYCDLRPIKDRYNPETKEIIPSVVNCVLSAESFLSARYGKKIEGRDTLYDFITVDCSGGNDSDSAARLIKDMLCFDGLYMPLEALEAVGYIPHDEAEIIEIQGNRYVRYCAAMQSASENRQCKLTMTTYKWEGFARAVSGDAQYLCEPAQTPQKAIARQGLGKTGGQIVSGFDFTYALVPDLETQITFKAGCFYDKENQIREENITATKNATDGCGFITPRKAKELADELGLYSPPSAFQVRYGQVKGILMVFDFRKYSGGAIKEDILFTQSMWKSGFDTGKAEFLVANVSKDPRGYAEFNYQIFTTLNNQLSFDDVLPYAEDIKSYMEKALTTPETALQFLGILNDIGTYDDDEPLFADELDSVDKVSAVIRANPQLAMNIKWVKHSIKKKIALLAKKMLRGKIPMPQSSVAIMAADPLAFFNRLMIDDDGNYSFESGKYIITEQKRAKELGAGEFYRGGFTGELLAMRNPLTHFAQIRKFNCVSHKNSAYWYRNLDQVVVLNAHDETNLGMGGADFDGDMCFLTQLFTDKFEQTDYIIYNNNDTGDKQVREILTEEVARKCIRANLQSNMLGIICNINTRCLELLHDQKSLEMIVNLAGYSGSPSFGAREIAHMEQQAQFADTETAKAHLSRLNHELTTLSELEVDRPKTGYANRFCLNRQDYAMPYTPYWFAAIKGKLDYFLNSPAEFFSENRHGEQVRTFSKNYGGKIVKIVQDTLKMQTGRRQIHRAIEFMRDGDTIMGNIRRYVQDNIIGNKIDFGNCFSITESLKSASCLDMAEATRIMDQVRRVYKDYCHSVAANIKALSGGYLSDEEFNANFEEIIESSDERLRSISSDRAAVAFAAYAQTQEGDYSTGSFPYIVVLDGMVALLSDLRAIDYYEIKIRHVIPDEADHLIVYKRRFRLPEKVCPQKNYFGDVSLPNGSYELHRDLKGGVSLIVPKTADKNRLNVLPFNDTSEFSLKVSYKSGELQPEHQNGEYVTALLAGSVIKFTISTINNNTQYCVHAGDTWVGTIFDDQSNTWVLRKEAAALLLDNEYIFVGVPRTGKNADSNSFVTSNGNPRTAQVLTFVKKQAAEIQ